MNQLIETVEEYISTDTCQALGCLRKKARDQTYCYPCRRLLKRHGGPRKCHLCPVETIRNFAPLELAPKGIVHCVSCAPLYEAARRERWAHDHTHCRHCGTTTEPHFGLGYCQHCYYNHHYTPLLRRTHIHGPCQGCGHVSYHAAFGHCEACHKALGDYGGPRKCHYCPERTIRDFSVNDRRPVVVCRKCMAREIRLVRIGYQLGCTIRSVAKTLKLSWVSVKRYYLFLKDGDLAHLPKKIAALLAEEYRSEYEILIGQRPEHTDQDAKWLPLWFGSRTGDNQALEELWVLTQDRIVSYLAQQGYFLPNHDWCDVESILYLAFRKAILDYQARFRRSLKDFLFECLRRKLISEIKRSQRAYQRLNHQALRLHHSIGQDRDDILLDHLGTADPEPLREQVLEELSVALHDFANRKLQGAALEREIFVSLLEDPDLAYRERASIISRILQKPITDKGIDNGLGRLRAKGQKDPDLRRLAEHLAII